MRTLKSAFGLAAALIPVLYCGGLFLYFNDVRDSAGGMLDEGLGPTILGLGALGLLFLIPLVLKILRLVGRPAAPGSGSGGGRPDRASLDEGSDFDPDAAIARYLAQRPPGASGPASALSPHAGGRPARPTAGFGRRGA